MIKSNKIEITKTSLKAGSRERGFYSVRTEKQNKNILTKQITKNQITLLDCEAKRKTNDFSKQEKRCLCYNIQA